MDAHLAKVVTEAWLHVRAGIWIERLAGRTEHVTDQRPSFTAGRSADSSVSVVVVVSVACCAVKCLGGAIRVRLVSFDLCRSLARWCWNWPGKVKTRVARTG